MSNRSHIRRRRGSDEEEETTTATSNEVHTEHTAEASALHLEDETEEESGVRMEDLKLLQKMRQRKKGLTCEELALGKPQSSNKKGSDPNDPFRLKSGGLVELKSISDAKQQQKSRSSKDVSTINDNFARETNTRDEDTEMQRYVEEQLIKLQGKAAVEGATSVVDHDELRAVFATLKKPEDTLFHVSKHLIADHSSHTSEEMLSEQMLSGIPEVEVGVDEKIRNIEETDKAKRKLIQTLREKKGGDKFLPSISSTQSTPGALLAAAVVSAVPATPTKTTAMNFVQHKRFNTDMIDNVPKRPKVAQRKEIVKPQPVVGNKEKHPAIQRDPKPPTMPDKPLSQVATDDLVFDQFRKNLHGTRNWKIRLA